jgi:hypothetical protein
MIQTAIILALAIGAASFTVSMTKIFAPFRVWAVAHNKNRFGKWFSQLVACPYCLSHWFSFGAVAIYRPRLVHMFLPLDYLVTALAMAGTSMLVCLVVRKALGMDAPKTNTYAPVPQNPPRYRPSEQRHLV